MISSKYFMQMMTYSIGIETGSSNKRRKNRRFYARLRFFHLDRNYATVMGKAFVE